MEGIFSPESRFIRFMSRVGDLILLNFLFWVTSIPIVTMGAAATALSTVVFRFDTEREEGTIKSYFRAFRQEFKQATLLWLGILACIAFLCADLYIMQILGGFFKYLNFIFGLLLVLTVFVATYAFPLLSQFDDKNRVILVNSLMLSVAYLPRTLLMAVLNLLPLIMAFFRFDVFLQCGFIWVLAWFAIAAYFDSLLLHKVFAPYIDQDETDEEKEENT